MDGNQPVALHNLGTIAQQTGVLEKSVSLFKQAIALKPDYPEAHYNLGNSLRNLGLTGEAVTCFERAIAFKSDYANAHNNLGTTFQDLGKLDEAAASYHRALAITPDNAEAHNNLGNAFKQLGKLDEAVASYHRALAITPDLAEAHYNLGTTFQDLGKLDEAVASYHRALAITPDYAEAHNNLGNAFKELGKLDEALVSYHKAVTIKPDYAMAQINFGTTLEDQGRLDEAVASYRKALAIKPDLVEAQGNLGNVLSKLGRSDEAIASYHKALVIKPDYAEVHNNLGNVLKDLGALDEAVASYNKALTIKPDYAKAHSNLLFSEQYQLGHSAQLLFELHCERDERHGRALRSEWPAHQNTQVLDRRLRVGFVSPDLGRHPVGYFIIPLLENLHKHEIETVCYSDRINDDLTLRIKAAANVWRETCGVSDEKLAQTILGDEIDILFDLSGHSARNRLLVFARKPAPLQFTWAGYVGTTGMFAFDYLVSDIYSTRVNEEHYFREKIISMPDGWLCYEPPPYAPEVGPLPCKQNGHITFCSFSNPAKLNADLASVWSKILNKVTNSRLMIKFRGIDSSTNKNRLIAMFDAEEVDKSRLMLEGQSPHAELLARYNHVDIALDPFPYSGGLTTYEALWMGVPVITVPGETFASRHSDWPPLSGPP